MTSYYRTVAGDILDDICWRHYGTDHAQAVPAVLAANPGLAEQEALLPAGLVIALPALPPAPERAVVRLWT